MTIDPDEGSRVHQRYIRVEGGVPIAFDAAPALWLTDSGQRPSDEWLRAQDPAYYGWIETPQPLFDPATEKVISVALSELVPNATDGTLTQAWQVAELTAAEMAVYADARKVDVTAERDRRLAAGFFWNGVRFDARAEDKTRIIGAAQLAFMYLAGGGEPAAADWNDPGSGEAFSWIAQDNSRVNMTAPQVIDFAKAAARWEKLNIDAARSLKDAGVPAGFEADANWPDPVTFMT